MKKFLIIITMLFIALTAYSQIPQKMSWQGILTDDQGVELDGNYNITLKIFDVQSNGTALWSETHTNVAISSGLANLTLGSVTPLDLEFNIQYWLELTIGSGSPLSRIALNSVPYALYAANTSNVIEGSNLTIKDNLGNVRIQFDPEGSKIHLINDEATTYFKAEESILSSKIFTPDKTSFTEILQQPTTLSFTGAATFNSNLIAMDNAFFNSGFYSSGNVVIDGLQEVYSHVYFDQTFNANGDVTFDNKLSVGGITTLTGGLVANGGATFNNGLSVATGNVNFVNNLTVGGLTKLNGNLETLGLINLKNGLNVTIGDVTFFNNFTVGGLTKLNGNFETNSNVNFKNGFSVTNGSADITDDLTVDGLTTLNGNLEANGISNFNNGLNVTAGDVVFDNKLNVNGISYLSEIDVAGGAFLNLGLDVLAGDVSISDDLWVAGNSYFTGDLSVTGEKNFRIDDPKDPYNKYLYHASIESDEVLNQYSGNVTTDASGTAVVTLPDYVQMININFRYQLTVIGEFAQAIISKEFSNNSFEIKTDKPNVKVSWQITAQRNDDVMKAKPFVPVRDKEPSKRGKLLFNLTK